MERRQQVPNMNLIVIVCLGQIHCNLIITPILGSKKKSLLQQNSVILNEGLVHRRGNHWEPSLNCVITEFM